MRSKQTLVRPCSRSRKERYAPYNPLQLALAVDCMLCCCCDTPPGATQMAAVGTPLVQDPSHFSSDVRTRPCMLFCACTRAEFHVHRPRAPHLVHWRRPRALRESVLGRRFRTASSSRTSGLKTFGSGGSRRRASATTPVKRVASRSWARPRRTRRRRKS